MDLRPGKILAGVNRLFTENTNPPNRVLGFRTWTQTDKTENRKDWI